jgi:hypothetical protein
MNAEFGTLDLWPLQPVERHKKIFQKYEALQPGEVLRIVKIRVRLPARRAAYSPEGGHGFDPPRLPAPPPARRPQPYGSESRAYSSERGVMKVATFTSSVQDSGFVFS